MPGGHGFVLTRLVSGCMGRWRSPSSLSRRRGSATGEADLSRPWLDVHAGLTSGHASVSPNCEADDEQSRCRLCAPTQVPAAARAALQRPSIPQAQAVQTPAVADEVLGGRRTTTPVRPCNRRSATTPADASRPRRIVAGLGPGAGQKKQAGGRACCHASPRRWSSHVGSLWPAHAGGRGQGAGRLPARYALKRCVGVS